MSLLTSSTVTNGLPANFPGSFQGPNNRVYFSRNDKDDLSEYYHHVAFNGQKHPIQDKFNYVKNLIHEKIHKKLHRGGGGGGGYYEHSGHESNKDQSAAISALTLLAFLFFLYILQSCIRDHVNQIMAAADSTTPLPPSAAFREMRQSLNRKGETEDDYLYYSDEQTEDISAKLVVKKQPSTTSATSLQVYRTNANLKQYFDEKRMEPVRLIIKP